MSMYFSANSEYEISPRFIQWELSCVMRSDGRSDMTAQIVAFFRRICKIAKSVS